MKSYFNSFKILVVSVLLLYCLPAKAQRGYLLVVDSLEENFSKSDQAAFDESDRLMRQAEQKDLQIEQIDKKIARLTKEREEMRGLLKKWGKKREIKDLEERSQQMKVEALRIYQTAVTKKYGVYDKKLDYYKNRDVPEAGRAELLRHEARELLGKATAQLTIEKERKDIPRIADDYSEINNNQMAALYKQILALCLFLNCKSIKADFDCPWCLDSAEIEQYVYRPEPEPEPVDTLETDTITESCKETLTYKVQIIATSRSLSKKRLNRYYPTDDEVVEMQDSTDGLWKYRVEGFDTYEEAQLYSDNTNVKDAFVLSFCLGKRIPLEEAVEIERGQPLKEDE